MWSADDLCPRSSRVPPMTTEPLATPLFAASVYRCRSPEQADALLSGEQPGYVYQRDGHPNADVVAEKCRLLHGAERAAVCSSGMAAMALALVSQCRSGDHVVVSSRLYGRTATLLVGEGERLGITSTVVDTCDLAATAAAMTPRTRLLVAETITNPTLRVTDIAALAELAMRQGAALLIDNTFASPIACRPVELGAGLVHESLTKIMNGHSDVVLGLLAGRAELWERVPAVSSTWGFAAAPFDCWLAERGLATLHLRVERAMANALAVARFLRTQPSIEAVYYPGLEEHLDHALARRQFGERFGSIVTFTLSGGRAAATRFIEAAHEIPFCPSLGEVTTTLSHPESTSHRALSTEARAAQGITGGTIRLSVGTESQEFVLGALERALAAASAES